VFQNPCWQSSHVLHRSYISREMVHSYISPKELSNAVSKVPLHPHNLLPATPKAADSHRGVETCPTYAQRTAHHSLGKAQWSCQQSSVPTTHTTTPCPARRRESHTQDASCILRLGIASPLQLRSVALDTQTCASNGDSEMPTRFATHCPPMGLRNTGSTAPPAASAV
jgi:hypothetical protein